MKLKELNPLRGPHVVSGSGALNMLNDSKDDSMLIMFREAVQNSWDARISDKDGIDFELRGFKLSSENISKLNELFDDSEYGGKLIESLKKDRHVLEVADSGTHGLTGPSGYELERNGLQQRYLKLVYDIGNSQEIDNAGGSYGYGKASFYRLSKIGFTAIYTRIKNGNDYESRLIFKCINKKENLSIFNTGAYWWGTKIKTGDQPGSPSWVVPLLNEEADSVWESLGGTSFDPNQTGTKILVFNPDFFNDELKSEFVEAPSWSIQLLAQYSVHLYWPKWPLKEAGGIRFKFIDEFNGESSEVPLDNPNDVKPYSYLIRFLNACKDKEIKDESLNRRLISTGNPKQNLGYVCAGFINKNQIDFRYTRFWNDKDAYVSLMRNVEFVTQYHSPEISLRVMNENEQENKILIGVFRTLDNTLVKKNSNDDSPIDLNEVYRESEDPPHINWISSNVKELGPWCVTYINQTLPKIDAFFRVIVRNNEPSTDESSVDAKVELMSMLGGPISGLLSGGGTSSVKNGSNGTSGRGTVRNGEDPSLEIIDFRRKEQEHGALITLNLQLKDVQEGGSYSIYPVCNDEDGRFNISNDSKYSISLPVRITDLKANKGELKKMHISKAGIANFELTQIDCELIVNLDVIGECNFILKIN